MEINLDRNKVTKELWGRYQMTEEFKLGSTHAIPSNHPLVLEMEERGLKNLLNELQIKLSLNEDIIDSYLSRTSKDWIDEWKEYHRILFKDILIRSGEIRTADERRYIGDPYDDIYHIPQTPGEIISQLGHVTDMIKDFLLLVKENDNEDTAILIQQISKIHFQFIRIHPFPDGNGRIGRFLIDQLAVSGKFPRGVGGYPRNDPERKKEYQAAIYACVDDPECVELTNWISTYMKETEENL